MVFNATFNNISAISWRSDLLVDETRVPGENHRPVNIYIGDVELCVCNFKNGDIPSYVIWEQMVSKNEAGLVPHKSFRSETKRTLCQ